MSFGTSKLDGFVLFPARAARASAKNYDSIYFLMRSHSPCKSGMGTSLLYKPMCLTGQIVIKPLLGAKCTAPSKLMRLDPLVWPTM